MSNNCLDLAQKAAKDCHTKAHWDDFLHKFGDVLASGASIKLVDDVFKRLESDPQSLHYNPRLWGNLLQGAAACWNTETGAIVAEFSKKLTAPVVSIPASQILLDAGKPALSREFAQRALRHSGLSARERIQLELIVASAFAEEGKTEHAVRVLSKVTPLVRTAEMTLRERADFVVRLGQISFMIGRYSAAAVSFEEASPLLLELQDWEGAARALFNAGACIQNSGVESNESAIAMVERCRKLSMEHNLSGPISHCEAFYGVEAFHIGNFLSAREHFRRALAHLPASDKSFRRLHIISFLSFTYFALGRFNLGIKFGRQTLELAAQDASERLKTRYRALEAEILWEEGKILQSMDLMKSAAHQLSLQGVKNLEEVATLARYQLQLSILGELPKEKFKIDESLQRNQAIRLEYLYSCALLHCTVEHYDESMSLLEDCLERAKKSGSLNYLAFVLLAMIRLHLQRHDLRKVHELLPTLESTVSRLGDTPIRAKLQFVYASIAYQSGDFERTVKALHAVEKMSAVSWPDRFVTQACLATIRGESPRFQHKWQEQLVSRFVRGYFAPTLKILENRSFVISNHYTISLEKHPAMADLVRYLSERGSQGATLAEIQQDVWKESINAQGWQQKIRNAVMRLRDHFPYTIAPIFIHNESLRFFGEAITVVRSHSDAMPIEQQVSTILRSGALSSQQIAEKIDVSLATAKRVLKKMSDDHVIRVEKHGRNVVYNNTHLS
jgi:tetratricopeptide (TPR) repeat protein